MPPSTLDRSSKSPRTAWLRYWPILAVIVGIYGWESGWAAILIYHAGIGWAVLRNPGRLRAVQWSSHPVAVAVLVAAGFLAGPVVLFGLPILTDAGVGEELADALGRLGLEGTSLWLFVAYFVLVHPAVEELGWRVVLEARSVRLHHHDLEFAAYHLLVLHWILPGHWILLLVAFATLAGSAAFWRWCRDRHGMVAVIACHAAADLAVLAASLWIAGKLPGHL